MFYVCTELLEWLETGRGWLQYIFSMGQTAMDQTATNIDFELSHGGFRYYQARMIYPLAWAKNTVTQGRGWLK